MSRDRTLYPLGYFPSTRDTKEQVSNIRTRLDPSEIRNVTMALKSSRFAGLTAFLRERAHHLHDQFAEQCGSWIGVRALMPRQVHGDRWYAQRSEQLT